MSWNSRILEFQTHDRSCHYSVGSVLNASQMALVVCWSPLNLFLFQSTYPTMLIKEMAFNSYIQYIANGNKLMFYHFKPGAV